jgi:VWFA-related protein
MLLVPVLALSALAAAAPAAEEVSRARFPVSAESVAVDLVVRDGKGALLAGLTPAEVEVREDGVRQEVSSVRLVGGSARPAGATDADAPAFLAFAFDRLSPEARAFAARSLRDYLAAPEIGPRVGLFSVQGGVTALAPFTRDAETLRAAVDGAVRPGRRVLASGREREEIRSAYSGLAEGVGQGHVARAEEAGIPECRGVEADQVKQTEFLAARMTSLYQGLAQDQQGVETVRALLALVAGLAPLPGRKALVLFSEGLELGGRGQAELPALVSAAQRSRVAIYPVDVAGLRAAAATDEVRRTLESIRTRLSQEVVVAPVAGPGAAVPGPSSMVLLERNEDALRLVPSSGLQALADGTGGFFVRDTNDLGPRLARVEEDLRSYYVVSYAPRDRSFDGRFRKIDVRVRRPHASLQARAGYLALPASLPEPALEHEAPALAALLGPAPRPSAVPLRLRGLVSPDEPPRSRVTAVVEVPAGALRFDKDRARSVYRQDFTVLVLVRDASGAVVAKLSRRYTPSGALGGLDAARAERVLFSREAELPPGRYRLEAAVHDALARRTGADAVSLDLPEVSSARLRASSLVVLDGARRADVAVPGAGLLRYDDVVLQPNVGDPVGRGGADLAFSITAWPGANRPVEATVEVVRDGRLVAASPAVPLRPEDGGRLRLVSSLPTAGLAPGEYELRVTLRDGRDAEERTEGVSIAR